MCMGTSQFWINFPWFVFINKFWRKIQINFLELKDHKIHWLWLEHQPIIREQLEWPLSLVLFLILNVQYHLKLIFMLAKGKSYTSVMYTWQLGVNIFI